VLLRFGKGGKMENETLKTAGRRLGPKCGGASGRTCRNMARRTLADGNGRATPSTPRVYAWISLRSTAERHG
jgi:hypothetical protein